MQPWAEGFYKSTAWQQCRRAYSAAAGGLCERCLARGIVSAGRVVHHKQHLTPETIGNPGISLAWDNLELLCQDCHAAEHNATQRRYRVDEAGHVLTSPPSR